jgi:hypothetical protein
MSSLLGLARRNRVELRSSWLFPMMVVAAASVIAFGCIGIAAITGHLPAARDGGQLAAPGSTPDQPRKVTALEIAGEATPGAGTTPTAAAEKGDEAASKAAKGGKKPLDRTVN